MESSALRKRMEEAGGPVELAPIANTPITLKLSADSKTIYETVGKLAGINVARLENRLAGDRRIAA